MEVGSITEISPRTGAKGIDVHEPKRAQGQAGLPELAGDQIVEVRTFVRSESEGEKEVAGAQCNLSAADFTAHMQSPAKVRVPLYRSQSSALAVSCDLAGFARKMVTANAIDVTRQGRYASAGSGGLIGVVAVAALDAMSDNTKNDWRYPPVRVVFEKDPGASAKAATAAISGGS